MLDRFKKKPAPIDLAIQELIADMRQLRPESDEYAKLLVRLQRLTEMKTAMGRERVSPNTIWNVAGYLGGVLIIVMYEQKHVFVSRAQAFLPKPK